MRNLLLFGPFLWLRSLVLWMIVLLLVLIGLLYFAAHSSLAVKKALDAFAPDYNITYKEIKGNAFNGFEITAPQYKHQLIAKKVTFKWNPNLLANKEIAVDQLHIKEANVDVIGALITSFSSEKNNTQKEENSTFDFKVDVNDVDISLAPFVQKGISITNASFKSNHLEYDKHQISIDFAALNISMDSNIYGDIRVDTIALKIADAQYDLSSQIFKKSKAQIDATSNITTLHYKGVVKDNHLLGDVILSPKPALYDIYHIPLRKDAVKKIVIDLDASKERVVADINTQAKKLLDAQKDAFNLDVPLLHSHVDYTISSSSVKVISQATVDTPYAKNIEINNTFSYRDKVKHYGKISIPKIENIDPKYAKLLYNIEIDYKGDSKGIDTDFYTPLLRGRFVSKDFKMAQVHLESKKMLVLKDMISLPKELQEAKADIRIDAPLNLEDFSKIDAQIEVKSNIVNIDAKVAYGKGIGIDGEIVIPENSLMKAYRPDVKWETLSPLKTSLRYEKDNLALKLKAKTVDASIQYDLLTDTLSGKMKLAGLGVDIAGNTKERLTIRSNINSLKRLGQEINKVYDVGELPPIEGKIEARLLIDKLQSATLNVSAPKLIYTADKYTKYVIKDVKLSASMDAEKIILHSYEASYDNQKYYASKKAKITLGETIEVSNFWLNDELLIEGKYNTPSQQGEFKAKATRFHVKNKMLDIYAKIDSTVALDNASTVVTGKITLLEGEIHPQASGKSFASDSDIIILQEQRKKKKNSFMDMLNVRLQIDTKQALLLRQKNIHLRLKPELTITKQAKSDMIFLGDITLLKGGTYNLEGKKIVLQKSHIYLTGKIETPTLDIKANYKSLNHLITIGVTGTPAKPRLDFSSSPALTKEQILSVLLFDTEAGSDTHSGNAMMKMMGGAMAKAALSEVGVKVDHLVFGEGNSIEVGKKLSKRVTVIYINGEAPKVKLKYKHNKHTESVIGVSRESQSYDIIFKKDF